MGEVRATVRSRPFDTSCSFTVHSLLVVDAMQTFGSDFELLVASHKNLWCVTSLVPSHLSKHLASSVCVLQFGHAEREHARLGRQLACITEQSQLPRKSCRARANATSAQQRFEYWTCRVEQAAEPRKPPERSW